MTYHRPPGSVEAALTDVIKILSPAELQAATGWDLDMLGKAANPMNGKVQLRFEAAANLDKALKLRGFAPVFAPLFAALSEPAVPAPAVDIERSLRQATIKTGALASAVEEASADGRISAPEGRRIAGAAQALSDEALSIKAAVEPVRGTA